MENKKIKKIDWVIPCNIKDYDIIGAFEEFHEIYWKQSTNINVGDYIYIYVGKPYSALMFKCEAIEVDAIENLINDNKYVINGSNYENYGRYMKIKLLETYDKTKFSLSELRDNGLLSIQGPSKISDQLSSFLNGENEKNEGHKGQVLFCNIAYMKYYNGTTIDDVPQNGGKYVAENGDALEKYNYFKENDGYVYGFVETKYTDGYKSGRSPKQIHIERINPIHKDSEFIDNVLVVFCAKSNLLNKTVIIGWYRNARVYRFREEFNGHVYNIKAKYEDCYLIPEIDRNYIIPRATTDSNNIGFGQSNLWYSDSVSGQEYQNKIIDYINDYRPVRKEECSIECPIGEEEQTKHAQLLEDDKLEVVAKHRSSSSPEVKEVLTKQIKRDPYIAEYVKRRANGICQLCEKKAPFLKDDGTPYLESHHIIELASGGDDSVENAVALCPNCHRKMHYAKKQFNVEKLQRSNIALSKKIEVGVKVLHKSYGQGIITELEDNMAKIVFGNLERKIMISKAVSSGNVTII